MRMLTILPAQAASKARPARARAALSGPFRARITRAYRAGPQLSDALSACQRLALLGIGSTTCYTHSPSDTAGEVSRACLAALESIDRARLDCYLSVNAAGFAFDAEAFSALARLGSDTGIRVHLDGLAPELADRAWELLERASRPEALGATLPGRWRRSISDADRAADLGVCVRVVKGEWADPERPHADPRRGFLDVVDRLAGRARRVAVATHDVPLLIEAVTRLGKAGTSCEVELLFGLPFAKAVAAARRLGARVRVYVPYGHVGPPYRLTEAARSPSVAWWLAQDLLLGEAKIWTSIGRGLARGANGGPARR